MTFVNGVKKTFKRYLTRGDRQTRKQTHGHRDSMTESTQWADSVKMVLSVEYKVLLLNRGFGERHVPPFLYYYLPYTTPRPDYG